MANRLNQQIAERLREMAELLERQGANRFRVDAYRRAGEQLAQVEEEVAEILDRQGQKGLTALPGIGSGIARAVAEMVASGSWAQLERLRGTLDPVTLFQTVPGIGPGLARRIHDQLHLDTLEGLENAAWNGSLAALPGIGPRRLLSLRATLASLLRKTRPPPVEQGDIGPGVEVLLAVDRLYREKATAGELPTIAPRRFNPDHDAWLPVLHHDLAGWHFTALYSNTARAHQLGKCRDWVVIYFYDDQHHEGQQTLVTETRGELRGQRVVRGREQACRDCYASAALAADTG